MKEMIWGYVGHLVLLNHTVFEESYIWQPDLLGSFFCSPVICQYVVWHTRIEIILLKQHSGRAVANVCLL